MAKRGKKRIDPILRNKIVTAAITSNDVKALDAVMAKKGIQTRSKAITEAIRSYVKANGVSVSNSHPIDPKQLSIE